MKTLIISGSSRKNGDTKKVVSEVLKLTDWDVIDLNDYNFSYYDYEHLNRDDDYLDLMKDIINTYDRFIFATPVYWYSMSGIMKVFFDRLTDLLTIEKELGRKLRGKFFGVICCSNSSHLEPYFWIPFKKSSEYLGMIYTSNLHVYASNIKLSAIQNFIEQIEKHK